MQSGLRLENGAGNGGAGSRIELAVGAATPWIESLVGGGNSNSGADLVFGTPGTGTSGSERLRITSAGSVGIGTSAPGKLTEISKSVSAGDTVENSILLRLLNPGTDGASSTPNRIGIGFGAGSTRQAIIGGTYGYDFLDFYTTGDLTTPRLRIAANGNVGIGTTNPGAKLEIAGTYANSGAYATTYHIDTTPSGVLVADGGTIDIPNFSGMVIVNNWSNGSVSTFLCGGGSTAVIGSVGAQVGTMVYVSAIAGYRWTNNYGAAAIFGMAIIRTRPTA